ncbi:MAG: DNA polymerase domain-containing protein [Candidatus Bathyarchaeia archaeon]
MNIWYLLDGIFEEDTIILQLFNPNSEEIRRIQDKTYRPYFLINNPLSIQDQEILRNTVVKTNNVEKIDLFTRKTRVMTRIETNTATQFASISKMFKEKWEDEVPHLLSYVYDQRLIFCAPYILEGNKLKITLIINESIERFREQFSNVKLSDPEKYEMLEYWFMLCSQPIPQIPLKILGIHETIDYEKIYLAFLLSRVANIPLSEAFSNRQVSTWIKSIIHFYLRKKNILIPRSSELRKGQNVHPVPGALTYQPKAGTYFGTVVVDFESLYPSLIDSYNLSYETIDCEHETCSGNRVPKEEHYVCKKRRGVYSILIGALKDLRIHWFKPLSKDLTVSNEERMLAAASSNLLKLILVASYGVTVRIHGLAQPALAESITAFGRYALRRSWLLAEEEGLKPLYGDTDSLFLDEPSEDGLKTLIQKVKDELHLDLAVDKVYSICVLPRAMKAYFGIKKDGTVDIKGLTAIKSSSPPFIRNVFMDCVKELATVKNWAEFEVAKKNIRQIVKRAVSNLQSGKVQLEDLVYSTKLHFDISDKTSKEEVYHQPYQCAIQLVDAQKKIHSGDVVSFLKVKPFNYRGKTFSVKPIEFVTDFREVNIDDYVRNLKAALSQTFKPMNISFDEDHKTTLADFI